MKFRVRLHSFAAQNLPLVADVYLKINFDAFKKATTEVVKGTESPQFSFDTSFQYETKYEKRLNHKPLVIEVYQKKPLFADVVLGSCTVTLQSLATGCVAHDLQLWNESQPRGRLTFSAEMNQISDITVIFKDVFLWGLPLIEAGLPCPVVQLQFSNNPDCKATSERKQDAQTAEWAALEQLRFPATLKELSMSTIDISVLHQRGSKSPVVIGTASIPLSVSRKDGENYPFNLTLQLANGVTSDLPSTIEGMFCFKNFPIFAQMTGGLHNDDGIQNATVFCDGVMLPNGQLSGGNSSSEEKKDDKSIDPPLKTSSATLTESKRASVIKSPAEEDADADAAAHEFSTNTDSVDDNAVFVPIASSSSTTAQSSVITVEPSAPELSPNSMAAQLSPSGSVALVQSQQASQPSAIPPAFTQSNSLAAASNTGSVGACVVCRKPADYVCSRTQVPVCGRECKHANMVNRGLAVGVPVSGSTGLCISCGMASEFICFQTKTAVCGRECKIANLVARGLVIPARPISNLPSGWSEAVTAQGQTYYRDEVNRRTQWDRPTQPAIPMRNLPSQAQFVPTQTPAQPQAQPQRILTVSSPMQYAAQQPLQQPQVQRVQSLGSPVSVMTVAPTMTMTMVPQQQPLPPGWEQGVDPKTGQTFYRNSITKTTHWQRPVTVQMQMQSPRVIPVAPPSPAVSYQSQQHPQHPQHPQQPQQLARSSFPTPSPNMYPAQQQMQPGQQLRPNGYSAAPILQQRPNVWSPGNQR